MRVGVVGSRRRLDRWSVDRLVASLGRADVVVSGGCRGVDTWAIEAADRVPLSHVEYLPVIRPGMDRGEVVQAYYDRNKLIAEDCDVLYAFVAPDRTGGTENTIKWANLAGTKVVLMLEAEEVDETGGACQICLGDGFDNPGACTACGGTGKSVEEVDET